MTIAEMRLPHKKDKRHIALPSKCAVLLYVGGNTNTSTFSFPMNVTIQYF